PDGLCLRVGRGAISGDPRHHLAEPEVPPVRPGVRTVKSKTRKQPPARPRDLALHLPLLVLLALTFYPFVFLLQTSLKDNSQFFHDFWGIRPPFHWQNYADAWG